MITVDYATADGTASSPADYGALSSTLTFNPGQTARTVTVSVNGDTLDEVNETYFLNLSNPSNVTIGDGQGLGTITDNDPLPALSVNDVIVTEGDSGTVAATFSLSLSVPSGRAVTVDYATADVTATAPSDYQAATGTVSFAAGQTSQQVTVLVNGDTLDEAAETFRLNLSNATNATLADPQGTGTIADDDPLVALSVNDASVLEGNSGTVSATFTVSLSLASGQTVTVNYATADGTATAPSDYTAASGTLSFSPGQTTRTVTVLVNGDTLDESTETYFLNLSNPGNATIADGQGLGTITNDDGQPSLSVNDVTVTEGDSGTTNATFTVTLAPASGQTVTVNYATADGTAIAPADYAATTGSLTFPPGQMTRDLHGARQRRHAGRDKRELHGRPLERGQRNDLGRARARHDHRRRSAADRLGQRRHGDRGQHRHRRRHVHGQPQRSERPRALGRLRDCGRHGDPAGATTWRRAAN